MENRQTLDWLQVARAFAAAYVAAYHAGGRVFDMAGDFWGRAAVSFGNAGVELFFVISGFIIFYGHKADLGRPEMLGRYAYRRTTRIYPPFWVLCACVMPLYFLVPSAGPDYARSIPHVAANLALLPMPPKPIIGISWTLILELIFYVMFGLAILNRRLGSVVFALWAAGILWFMAVPTDNYLLRFLFSVHFSQFMGGMACAVVVNRWKVGGRAGLLIALAGVACLVLAPRLLVGPIRLLDSDPPRLEIAYAVAGMLIVAGAVWADKARIAAPRALVILGNATYSVYLFHWVAGWVMETVDHKVHFDRFLPPEAIFVIMVVAMLAVGLTAHWIVERPLLNLARKVWDRRQAARTRTA